MQKWSPVILRIGLGLVILWFGQEQLNNPSSWIGYLPEWVNKLPISPANFVLLNGWFEVIFGISLIAGFYTRIVSFILSIHLLSIVCTVGYNEIGIRDFGLTVALVSIFLYGPSGWSVDEFRKRIT